MAIAYTEASHHVHEEHEFADLHLCRNIRIVMLEPRAWQVWVYTSAALKISAFSLTISWGSPINSFYLGGS